MTKFKAALVAMSALSGAISFGSAAEAQYYGHPPQGYYYQQPRPQYVDPRVARKQAQLAERFHQKYGYVQPQPQYYGGGYYQQPQPQYYQPQPRYVQPQGGYYQSREYRYYRNNRQLEPQGQ
jgi:hypothetical protein